MMEENVDSRTYCKHHNSQLASRCTSRQEIKERLTRPSTLAAYRFDDPNANPWRLFRTNLCTLWSMFVPANKGASQTTRACCTPFCSAGAPGAHVPRIHAYRLTPAQHRLHHQPQPRLPHHLHPTSTGHHSRARWPTWPRGRSPPHARARPPRPSRGSRAAGTTAARRGGRPAKWATPLQSTCVRASVRAWLGRCVCVGAWLRMWACGRVGEARVHGFLRAVLTRRMRSHVIQKCRL